MKILSSIDGIAEKSWDDVIGATPLAQHGSLRTFESASTLGTLPQYFVLGSVDRPLAVAIGRLARTAEQCKQITSPLLGRAAILAPALAAYCSPMLILSLRPMYGPALLADPHKDREAQKSLLSQLCSEIERFADERRLTIAVAGITDRDQLVIEVLRERGFYETLGYPVAELEVYWDSWDGYLDRLKPRRRQFIRREANTFEARGCRIRTLKQGEPIPAVLYELLHEHYQRRNNRKAPYNNKLLDVLRKNTVSNSRIYIAEHQDQILGFLGVLWKDTVGATPYLGIGSQVRASNMFVYFNLIFYQLVRDAPELGLHRILYGTGVYEAKRLRGCSIIPTRLFLRPRRGLATAVTQPAFALHRRWYEKKLTHLFS